MAEGRGPERVPFAADDVRRLARAARLTLAPGEEAVLARDLDRILESFGGLPPGEATEPAMPAPPRADVARPGEPAILANAPRRDGDLVRVPKRGG